MSSSQSQSHGTAFARLDGCLTALLTGRSLAAFLGQEVADARLVARDALYSTRSSPRCGMAACSCCEAPSRGTKPIIAGGSRLRVVRVRFWESGVQDWSLRWVAGIELAVDVDAWTSWLSDRPKRTGYVRHWMHTSCVRFVCKIESFTVVSTTMKVSILTEAACRFVWNSACSYPPPATGDHRARPQARGTNCSVAELVLVQRKEELFYPLTLRRAIRRLAAK
jgi:hypothetical protein